MCSFAIKNNWFMKLDINTHFQGYEVRFVIKRGDYAQSLQVRDAFGRNAYLKVIDRAGLKPHQLSSSGRALQVELSQQLSHRYTCRCLDAGEVTQEGTTCDYIVSELVSGEDLAKKMRRDITLPVYQVKQIAADVLEALQHLHTLPMPVAHNAVTPEHVMIDMSDTNHIHARLVNMGHATPFSAGAHAVDNEISPFYQAPEHWDGVSSPATDVYMVGALMYHCLFGVEPWHLNLDAIAPSLQHEVMMAERRSPLKMLNVNLFELDEQLMNVVAKALTFDPEHRFATPAQMLDALQGKVKVEPQRTADGEGNEMPVKEGQRRGNGFADVAGMDELKEMLNHSVINILRNIERAKRYKLTIPNGMLLYGPPGCGKTFIAEKFAEETGYNFVYVKSSDLASVYIHGSQEKIGNLFRDARKKAPTILCFDEFDALVPARSEHHSNVSYNSEVNEFLSQLNNCGQDGVFVIASSNQPDLIDKAVLRRGRIDKIVYVPLPDEKAREGLFEIYLKERPLADDVDCRKLARLTANYVSSDIAYIVNEAAMQAAERDALIDQDLLEATVKANRPSVSKEQVRHYEALRDKLSTEKDDTRRSVGFF